MTARCALYKWIERVVADIWSFEIIQLGFDLIRNSAIRSADPTLEPNMKCIGSPAAEIWPFAYLGAHGTPILGEGEIEGGQRWHHSKERWRFPIRSPL